LAATLKRRWSSPNVTFFGRVDDLTKFDLMARAHALVVTSVREGWGMVVTEAAAVGTQSIAYDVPGLAESVRRCQGVLIPPNVDSLSRTLMERIPCWTSPLADPVVPSGVKTWDEVGAIM